MVAFAANSAFCRAAMLATSGSTETMHPVWFTAIRVLSGACVLWGISRAVAAKPGLDATASQPSRRPAASAALFVYALCFSLAYTRLDTGTGAIILFGTVQITMFGDAARGPRRPPAIAWLGMTAAMAGLGYMLLPGAGQPDPLAAASMFAAGAAWGAYSLIGRSSAAPLQDTASAFVGAAPLTLAALGLFVGFTLAFGEPGEALGAAGGAQAVAYALASGVLASGLGYALWYATLPSLRSEIAAVIQLSVPIIAAVAGAVWLGELPSVRTLMAAPVVLLGIALVIRAKRPASES